MSYWDTSAVVKLLTVEADSDLFRHHAATTTGILSTAEFTRLELWTTLRRKEADGFLQSGEARGLLADFDLRVSRGNWTLWPDGLNARSAFIATVETCLSQQPPLFIRTLDALHLAAAADAGEKNFVATDARLRDAASLLGFNLFPAIASP